MPQQKIEVGNRVEIALRAWERGMLQARSQAHSIVLFADVRGRDRDRDEVEHAEAVGHGASCGLFVQS